MIKIIPDGSFDFGERVASLIKVSSSGLRGHDLSVLIKRAGHELADTVRRMDRQPGEELIHLLAMGAVEGTGANRNTDGWKAATLQKDHHTFAKLGRWYRHHNNRDTAKSYGIVKESHYNPDMKRVELIVGLNGTKEAAERNKGLVASEELDALNKDASIAVSMSTKCGYDICNGCQHRAKNRSEYCTASTCEYGGLQKNAGRVFEDGKHLYADTYENRFFDISKVFRPADRTAYVFGKVASADDHRIGGAELAELMGVSAPAYLLNEDHQLATDVLDRIKLARDLAAQPSLYDHLSMAFSPEVRPGINTADLQPGERRLALKALAQQKIALSLPEWLQAMTGEPSEQCANTARRIQPHLTANFRKLAEDQDLPELLRANVFPNQEPTVQLQKWAGQYRANHALEPSLVQRRAWLAAVRGAETFKKAEASYDLSPAAAELARHYCAYQVEAAREGGIDGALLLAMNQS